MSIYAQIAAVLIALGLVIATVLGAQIALNLPADILQRLYGLFLVYIGWRFAEPRKFFAALLARRDCPRAGRRCGPNDECAADRSCCPWWRRRWRRRGWRC